MAREVRPADHDTPISGTPRVLADFWRWAYSDLVSNDVRGVLAEYLVGLALGVVDEPRVSWAAHDLTYRGAGIEVKATGDWQSWPSSGSKPLWSIRQARPWDAASNTYGLEPVRSARLYVFCHWQGPDDSPLGPLSTETWEFHVVSTLALDDEMGKGKSISLAAVRRLVGSGRGASCRYPELRAAVDAVLDSA